MSLVDLNGAKFSLKQEHALPMSANCIFKFGCGVRVGGEDEGRGDWVVAEEDGAVSKVAAVGGCCVCIQRDCVCAKASRSMQWGCKGCKGSCEGEASHRFLFCSNIIAPSRARLVSESSHHHHPSPWLILPDTFARVLPMRVIQTSLSLVG